MKRLLSLLLVLCSLLSLCVFAAASDETESGEDDQAVLARAVYPSMSPRPRQEDYVKENGLDLDNAYFEAEKAWRQDLGALRSQPKGYADGLQPWFRAGIRQFLSDAQGENRVFSSQLYIAGTPSMVTSTVEDWMVKVPFESHFSWPARLRLASLMVTSAL